MIKRFDKNGDGMLDEAEQQAAFEARRAKGKEGRQHGPMHAEILKRFDHDGDGMLNEAERESARQAREELRGRAQVHRQELLSRFDRDGDGKINETERQEMHDAWQKFIQQQPSLKSAGN